MTATVKTAIITGASSGIGQACAEIFAKGKWNLVIVGMWKRNHSGTPFNWFVKVTFNSMIIERVRNFV